MKMFCRSPMKLSGVGFSPSKQIKNTNDILVNSKSKASIVRRLAFAFEDKLIPSSAVRVLSDIIKDFREFQRVSVKHLFSNFQKMCLCDAHIKLLTKSMEGQKALTFSIKMCS